MQIAIIGKGNVGSALGRGLERAGHQVTAVGKEPARVKDAARAADVIILAVPFAQVDAAVGELGDAANGKPVVDVTNALTKEMQLAVGYTTSGAEELQKKLPSARVVKAFNTVFAAHMDTGQVDGEPLAALVAGDDPGAKKQVIELARDIGFDPVDAGPLRSAREIEPLALLNIKLGYVQKLGSGIGFKLVH